MEDLFKKFINAGVGYIAQGSKTMQTTIEKLVKDNKMTQEEGKKIVEDLLKSGETKRVELEKQFQGLSERIMSSVGLGETKAKSSQRSAAKAAPKKAAAKPAGSATSKAAGTTKKASPAGSAQKPATAKAAAKKPAAKKAAAPAEKADNQA